MCLHEGFLNSEQAFIPALWLCNHTEFGEKASLTKHYLKNTLKKLCGRTFTHTDPTAKKAQN